MVFDALVTVQNKFEIHLIQINSPAAVWFRMFSKYNPKNKCIPCACFTKNKMIKIWMVTAVILLSGCYTAMSEPFNTNIFSLEETEFVSYMRDMSVSIGRIEDSSIADSGVEETRALILNELIILRSLAVAIKSDEGREPNYITQNNKYHGYLTRLEADIEKAMVQIEQNPPNFYIAGKIVGACKGCHETL